MTTRKPGPAAGGSHSAALHNAEQDRPSRVHASAHSRVSLALELGWQSDTARHAERLFAGKLTLSRDIFPGELAAGLLDQPPGHTARLRLPAGTALPDYRECDRFRIRREAFRGTAPAAAAPRAGRYYPRRLIAGTRSCHDRDMTPFRVVAVDDDLVVDVNHPLAGRDLEITAHLLDARPAGGEPGGRRNDIVKMLADDGPGMQARCGNRPTDFWSDKPFHRDAGDPDAAFYATPRLVDHIDTTAAAQVTDLYTRLCRPGGTVLDLMTSWKSHLDPALELAAVAGLGMNREELDRNPRLDERTVHDINADPVLPYPDASFDTVLCTVSVEYLVRPVEVFADVRRVLKPGGRFIVTFSNRWFPPKVIRIWREIHEFERPGLVLEYFLAAGGFSDLHTRSVRGLPRPAGDRYAGRLVHADPVYAVWGTRD